ncbi:major facilitator superfamily domain-containing protein [Xylariales sp. AK1849]|nr:major facilitator superfamily domain-containing protein [Xylariales sp. AK1849]
MTESNTTPEKNVLGSEAQLEPGIRALSSRIVQDGTQNNASAIDDNVRKITGLRWVLVCAALYFSALMYGLDTTIAADVQGAVIQTFDEISQLAWIGAGFPLGSVAVILPYGVLFGKFNMKWLYVAGIVLFQVGSALCGAAPTMNALIVGRVIAGAGGTGMYLGCLNHFSALCTREEKGTYIAGIGFCWGIGTILGPVVGGGFSDSSATWRWGFYINLVIGAITAPVYLFYLPPIRPSKGISIRERLSHLDFVGSILSAGLWVAFAMAFISAGGIWPWDDGRTIATIVVFVILFVLYAVQQYFSILTMPSDRSFPGHLLRSRTQVLLYITTSCTITAAFVATFYIPLYFQFVQNDTPLMAAVRLLPFLLVMIAVNLASGWALSKVDFYMPFYLVSGILITLSGALFYAYLKPSTPVANIYGFSIILAVGTGLTMQLGYVVASLKVRSSDIVNAINLQNVSQVGSTAICLVIAGQVFQSVAVNNLKSVLAGQGFSQEDIHGAIAGAQSALFQQLTGDLRKAALEAITSAMQKAFILVIVGGALEVVCAVAMRRERLFGETTTA